MMIADIVIVEEIGAKHKVFRIPNESFRDFVGRVADMTVGRRDSVEETKYLVKLASELTKELIPNIFRK